jgi:hypothetical protein
LSHDFWNFLLFLGQHPSFQTKEKGKVVNTAGPINPASPEPSKTGLWPTARASIFA